MTTFALQAYDESDGALGFFLGAAACDPIRRTEITLTAERNGVTVTLRTRVFFRCTMQGAG